MEQTNQLNPRTGHPTYENLVNVASVFLHGARGIVNPFVTISKVACDFEGINFCGTSACHAGWYHIIVKGWIKDGDFDDGAKKIALELGFDIKEELLAWAENNPELWGDDEGDNMFADDNSKRHSFGENPTLQSIGEHWLKVAESVKELEAAAEGSAS